MPQYHPPRSLAGQPFSWVIADFQPDLAALQAFVRAFPSEPGIRQVIAPVAIPTLEPGLEATEVPAEAGQGSVWYSFRWKTICWPTIWEQRSKPW